MYIKSIIYIFDKIVFIYNEVFTRVCIFRMAIENYCY